MVTDIMGSLHQVFDDPSEREHLRRHAAARRGIVRELVPI